MLERYLIEAARRQRLVDRAKILQLLTQVVDFTLEMRFVGFGALRHLVFLEAIKLRVRVALLGFVEKTLELKKNLHFWFIFLLYTKFCAALPRQVARR